MKGTVLHGARDIRYETIDDPVRRFLPDLIKLVLGGKIKPGKVFDLQIPISQPAEGYKAMDERRAIKALLWP